MMDAGMVDMGAPPMLPPMPQVVNSGGPVLGSAWTIVPIFYSTDTNRTEMENLLSLMGKSKYFAETTSEYGVSQYTLAKSIVLQTAAPANISDQQVAQFLASQADGAHAPWPKASPSTLLIIFYPQTTTITLQGGASCATFGGYHANWNLADSTAFPYAVLPFCPQGGLQGLTSALSHEVIEAATDPFPRTTPAYTFVDDDHLIWGFASSGGEVGDMCAGEGLDSFGMFVGNYYVQRSWSNEAIKKKHDPCVPAPANYPYFNAVPLLPDDVTLNFGQPLTTKGVTIPIGESKTIDVMLFSDMAKDPWTVSASQLQGSGNIKLSLDNTMGQDGDVLHLTIDAVKTTMYGASGFVLTSTDGIYTHKWYGLVSFQ